MLKNVWQRDESESARWMTHMLPNPNCTNEPVSLHNIASDYFFPNPLWPFGQGSLPLSWPEISFGTLHLVLDSRGEKLSGKNDRIKTELKPLGVLSIHSKSLKIYWEKKIWQEIMCYVQVSTSKVRKNASYKTGSW